MQPDLWRRACRQHSAYLLSSPCFRHLRNPRVLCLDDGSPPTQKVARGLVMRPLGRAKVKAGVHILRHTFCSHLAMRGAPARAIQELAGHQDLSTTRRYMHLSPAVLDAAIRLLRTTPPRSTRARQIATRGSWCRRHGLPKCLEPDRARVRAAREITCVDTLGQRRGKEASGYHRQAPVVCPQSVTRTRFGGL
jgi:hypothetical protein